MFCPNCGTENAEGAGFCASCGSALNAAPAAPVEEAAVTPTKEKKDILAPVKPLMEKIEPIVQKNKLLVAGVLGVLALVICISILVALFSSNGYIAAKHSISVTVQDEEVFIISDGKKAKATGMEAKSIESTQSSLDGTYLAFTTSERELAVVKGTKLTKVAEEVVSFRISEDGTGIAYIVKEDGELELFLYNVKNKKAKSVSDDVASYNYAIAPNGDSVAYYEMKEDDEESKLMFFTGSKSTKITSGEVNLLGIANKGKFIYCTARNDDGDTVLYTYNKKGDREKLGNANGADFVYFNDDHTQILFKNDGKSYISKKGKEAVKISSSSASMLTPDSAKGFYNGSSYVTAPTDDLFNKVYYCDGNLWYIRKNPDKSEKLANDVSYVTLSEDGKLVYYINKGELKVLKVKHGDNASDKAKVLCDENVDSYVVTSDCKKVYYVCDDSLYAVNGKTGKGKKTIANDDVSDELAISRKDVVYYQVEGDVYASKNGGKGKKVVSDATEFWNTCTGIVYIETEDARFATKGAKKPSKILTYE